MSDKGIILRVLGSIAFVAFIFAVGIFIIDRPFELEHSWLSWLLAALAAGVSASLIFGNAESPYGAELRGGFPFRRFFARSIDGFIVLALIIGLSTVLKPSLAEFWSGYLNGSGQRSYLHTVAVTVLIGYTCILIEIPVLKVFGTTPGKWLFGIYLTDKDGGRLSFEQVKGRSFSLFARGMAFCIDIAYYVAAVISYFRLKRQGRTRWDEDYGVKVHQRAWSTARAFACVYAVVFMLGTITLFVMYGQL